jgi:hypothetical protein
MYKHYTNAVKSSTLREPSFLEVLYPPKEAGTRVYVPAFAPPVEKISECEKLCGLINNVIRSLSIAFLIGCGTVALAVCLVLGG